MEVSVETSLFPDYVLDDTLDDDTPDDNDDQTIMIFQTIHVLCICAQIDPNMSS